MLTMKKCIALLLACLLTLGLVPAAFAAVTTVHGGSYKLTVTAAIDGDYKSAETWKDTYTDTAAQPAVEIKMPYKAIDTTGALPTGIWEDEQNVNISVAIENMGFGMNAFQKDESTLKSDLTVKINGEKKEYATDTSEFVMLTPSADGTKMEFKPEWLTSQSAMHTYTVELSTAADAAGNSITESMTFSLTFTNTEKPKYELKVVAADNAYLRDGIWFRDTEDEAFEIIYDSFELRKNDGSKFTETTYCVAKISNSNESLNGAYPKVTTDDNGVNKLDENGKTTCDMDITRSGVDIPENGDKYEIALRAETEYAFYETTIIYKCRTNIHPIDPKGVFFAKDSYTIGVNQVFYPTFSYIVDPLKDIVGEVALEQTAYGEKNIIDIDSHREGEGKPDAIIGLKEGTAYVKLQYTYNNTNTYTDTVKIIVSGMYQVQPEENFIVTTADGSDLNKRAAASTTAKLLGKLPNGSKVRVVELKDGWAKAIAADYTNFYVKAAYLTREETKPANGKAVVITRCVNVRTGAGLSYPVAGHLYRNEGIEPLGISEDGLWVKVQYQGKDGYVNRTYIQ